MFKTRSKDINELAKALCFLQGEMQKAIKDTTNPFFKSKYADLSSIWGVCREPLAVNGLSVTQGCDVFDGKDYLVTTLMHNSGQWVSSRFQLTPVTNKPQDWGSAVTYARRYMLAAILGVVTDDDDGNVASGNKSPNPPEVKQPKQETRTAEQLASDFTYMFISKLFLCKTTEEMIALQTEENPKIKKIEAGYPELYKKIKEANTSQYAKLTEV